MRKINEQQPQEQGFHLNLGEYWRVLWRRKYLLLVPLFVSVVVANIGVHFLVPTYEASTVIRVEDRSSVNQEVARFLQGDRRDSRDAEMGNSIEADLQGSEFLDALIRNLGMNRDPDLIELVEAQRAQLYPGVSTEDLVFRRLRKFLKRRISVKRSGPGLLEIIYSDANPDACYVLAGTITQLYIDSQQRQMMQELQGVSQFSEEQLAVYKERLDRSEHALERYQQQMSQRTVNANPVTAGNAGLADRVRRDIDITIRNGDNTIAKIRARLISLTAQMPDPDLIGRNAELKRLAANLSSRRETELLSQLQGGPAETPTANAGEAGVAAAQLAMQRHLIALVPTIYPSVAADHRPLVAEYFYQQIELQAMKDKLNRLDGYLRVFREEIALAPQMDVELASLRQEVESNRSLYNSFQNSRTTTQISEAAHQTALGASIIIVEKAARPLEPSGPDRMKILILAVFFGLAIGGSGLLLTEFSDSSFRSVEDVERQLGLKVLGTVPRFGNDNAVFKDAARRRAIAWSATAVLVIAVSLAGFYFYGKSTREQLIDLNVSSAATPQE